MNNLKISDLYLSQQKELHHNNINYGVASLSFVPIVSELIDLFEIKSISDYGAGKKNLQKGLIQNGRNNFEYYPYDPVFPEYGPPKEADLVCCIDVLEHIEPEYVTNVISDLASITKKFAFFSIHLGPAVKILNDGRNAHLIQKPTSWWLPLICVHFEILQLQSHNNAGNGFWMILIPKNNQNA